MDKFLKDHETNVGKKKKTLSEITKLKMSLSKKGKKWTSETREKMKNRIPWNKGKVGLQKLSEEFKKNLSERMKGNQYTKGKRYPPEIRKKFGNQKENHPGWKGGYPKCSVCGKQMSSPNGKRCIECIRKNPLTPLNLSIRNSIEYKLWRTAIFERDKYKCIWCGQSGNIQADHIKPFCDYPELRFAIDNGRTLCIPCHRKTDTWGRKASNYKKINKK